MNDYDKTEVVPWDEQVLKQGAMYPTPMKARTRLERLKDARRGLEEKLKEVNAAIEALEANPEITKVMELVERAGF